MNNINEDEEYKQITVVINGEPKVLRYKKPKLVGVDAEHGYLDGLKISDMSDEHLLNSIKYFKTNIDNIKDRKVNNLVFKLGRTTRNKKKVGNKKVKTELENEINQIAVMNDIEFLCKYSSYKYLVDEAEKRDLI